MFQQSCLFFIIVILGKNCEKRNQFKIGAETKPDFSKYYTVDLNQNVSLGFNFFI